jgi:hypothetical protein
VNSPAMSTDSWGTTFASSQVVISTLMPMSIFCILL